MTHRTNCLLLIICISISAFNMGFINSAQANQSTVPNKIQGKVIDIINVTGYTYAEVDTGTDKIWAAAPTTVLKTGDTVSFSTAMPMKNFYSESMNRNFSLIYFVSRLITDNNKSSHSLGKPSAEHTKNQPVRQQLEGIEPIKGGKSISEVHAEKNKLKGKVIRVRGQVTRFAAQVMGKNWLHIQDSSGFDDLTVTTSNTVAVGDIVIVEGTLELDKDYDYGYVYPVILQDAKVTKE